MKVTQILEIETKTIEVQTPSDMHRYSRIYRHPPENFNFRMGDQSELSRTATAQTVTLEPHCIATKEGGREWYMISRENRDLFGKLFMIYEGKLREEFADGIVKMLKERHEEVMRERRLERENFASLPWYRRLFYPHFED